MLTVGVGQCGVQVSAELWKLAKVEGDAVAAAALPALPAAALPADITSSASKSYATSSSTVALPRGGKALSLFDGAGMARAVMVDSEPKACRHRLARYFSCKYDHFLFEHPSGYSTVD